MNYKKYVNLVYCFNIIIFNMKKFYYLIYKYIKKLIIFFKF